MARADYLPIRVSDVAPNGGGRTVAPAEVAPSASEPLAVDDTLPEVLLRRWRIVLAVLVLAWVGGAAYLWYTPPSYESTARVVVPGGKRGEDPMGGALARVHPKIFAELMQTRAVLTAAAADPEAAATATLAGRDDPAGYLGKRLDVDTDAEEGLVELTITTHSAEDSAVLANALARAFWEHYLATRGVTVTQGMLGVDEAMQPPSIPRDPTDTLEAAVEASDPAAVALARSRVERLAQERDAAGLASQKLARLSEAADEAGADVAQLENLAQAAELRIEADKAASDLDRRITATAEAIRQFESRVGTSHPALLDLREQMAGLERDIADRRAARAQVLRKAIRDRREHAQSRLAGADRELAAARAESLALERVEARRAPAPMLLLERAEPASRPVWPKPVPVMALASVAGLVFGSMLAFGKDAWSQRRRVESAAEQRGGDAAGLLLPAVARLVDEGGRGVPLLGVVPELDQDAGAEGENLSALAVHEVRVMLQMRVRQEGGFAYAVTSPNRGTGKTSIAVAVASSLAGSGTRTLLVDSDLTARLTRRGGSSRALDSGDVAGGVLAELSGAAIAGAAPGVGRSGGVPMIAGDTGVAAALGGRSLESSIVQTQEPNLHLLPVVGVEARDVAKMSSAFIRRIIKEARDDYDLVLFDTGPVPGSAEALLVCGEVDGVILVGSPRTDQNALNRCLSYLKVCGARVIGTVLNGAGPQHAGPGREHIGSHRPGSRGGDGYADVGGGSGMLAAAMYSAGGTDPAPTAREQTRDDPRPPRTAREITPFFDDEEEAVA